MWSDNESKVDLLQFRYLAKGVTRIIITPELLPATIGVHGDWGSGKSSLLHMVRTDLEQTPGILCLSFSGWLFENYEDAKTALMGSILEALQDHLEANKNLSDKAKDLLGKLLKRVNWLQVASMTGRHALPALMGMPHISALNIGADLIQALKKNSEAPSIEEIQKLLEAAPEGAENVRRNIRDFHRDFEELLRESGLNCLVVFIDDLDRCLPDTVIETLEAIKLFLFVPKTAFVIGADERLVQYAVRRRFPELPGVEAEVGRDYLEKLIQFPVRIPALGGTEIESYINALFSQLDLPEHFESICAALAEFKPGEENEHAFNLAVARRLCGEELSQEFQDDTDLTAQVAPFLTLGLSGNPRRTKRFLNTLIFRLHLSQERGLKLDRPTLAKLMLLEYIRPEFWKQLAQIEAEAVGSPSALVAIEKQLRRFQPATTEDTSTDEEDAAPEAVKVRDEPLPESVSAWLADPWMKQWLTSEPALANLDLRPYFTVAHDNIGALLASPLHLSPAALEVLRRILDPQDITQKIGFKRAETLSLPDVTAIFDNLCERIRISGADDFARSQSILSQFAGVRREILPQLVAFYSSLPETKIPASSPSILMRLTKTQPAEAPARQLLERWGRSKNNLLANAAKRVLRPSSQTT